MEERKTYKYTDLCTLIGGGTPKTSEPLYWNGDIPWLSVKDFVTGCKYVYSTEKHISEAGLNNSSTKLLQKNDIIISARGTVGAMAMIPFPMAFNQSCFGIRANKNVDSHFLYYLTKTKIVELQSNSHGSVFDTITRDTFDKIECSIPGLSTQRKIATILSNLDCKIELNNRINHNLEVQAQALFKSWFVDFEPFKEGKFVDSELGLIPEGWGVYRVGELPLYIADYVANGSFASLKENVKLYESENYAVFIRNTDLKSGSFPVYVDFHSYTFLSKTKLTGGEIIISNVGDVGSVHFCPELCKPMTLGNNVIMIKTEERQYYAFLYLCFKYFAGHHSIESITGGSAMPKFNKTDFKGIKLIIPSTKVLSRFDEIVSPMFKRIGRNKRENEKLSKQRDTLLPLLLSGQITC